jgi:hypothetical protein
MPDAMLPLIGMRIRLTRTIDVPCCQCGETVVVSGQGTGPHAACLRCASCDRHRGWLPKALTEFLAETIRLFGPLPDGITIRNNEFAEANAAATLGAPATATKPHHNSQT